jgi:glutathione peroxidase
MSAVLPGQPAPGYAQRVSILDAPIARLDGTQATFGEIVGDRAALVVNVASKCGLTPQYSGLEELQRTYGGAAFTVVGVPCNQFMGQEPGGAEEIAEFCSATYGVSFPMTEKVEVNGDDRHPVYAELTSHPNERGEAGDVTWNFEKFLIAADGTVIARFGPQVTPEDPRLVDAVKALASH